jgi:hypothetical protein
LGIDSGGVAREWWEAVTAAALAPAAGLFAHAATDNLSYQVDAAGAEVRLVRARAAAQQAKAAAASAAASAAAKAAARGMPATAAAAAPSEAAGVPSRSAPAAAHSAGGAEAPAHGGGPDLRCGGAESLGGDLSGLGAYRFVGRLLAKALLDEQTVPAYLCRPLFKHVLGWPVGLADLEYTDAALHQTLTWLLDPAHASTVGELDIVFAVDEPNPFVHARGDNGSTPAGGGSSSSSSSGRGRAPSPIRTRALVPGGANLSLTAANVPQFVGLRFKDAMQVRAGA